MKRILKYSLLTLMSIALLLSSTLYSPKSTQQDYSTAQAKGFKKPTPKPTPKPKKTIPPKHAKTKKVGSKRYVQTTFSNGKKEWTTIINGKYANKKYQGVKFNKKGFPNFPRVYQMTINNADLTKGRTSHFKTATAALKKSYEKDPKKFKNTFNKKQIKAIKNGNAKIPGYTWHHHQTRGLMQLVKEEYHDVRHTGGIAIWGDKKK